MARYQNRYATLVKEALEARDGTSINLIDVAKTGHTSPYGQFEIDDLDAIIAEQFGGELSGDGSPVNPRKSMPYQLGRKYGVKKVRNIYWRSAR